MNDTVDIESFLHIFQERPALALVALAIWYVTQHFGTDSKFPITIPDRYKPLVAAGLGGLASVVDKIANASTWREALAVGLYSAIGAVMFQAFGVKMLLGKSTLGVPKALQTETEVDPRAVTVKKRFPPDDGPPSAGAGTTVATTALAFGAMALLLPACTAAQVEDARAKSVPALSFAEAVAQQAHDVLGFVAPLLPPGDAQVVAARAAETAGDLGKVFDMSRGLLERAAADGNDIPESVAAQVVTGAAAAKAIEQGVRALDGRDGDGNLKPAR